MIQSRAVNEWKAEARVETRAEAVLDFLQARFDSVPEELAAKVRSMKALDVLQKWCVLAGKANSLDDFRRDAGV